MQNWMNSAMNWMMKISDAGIRMKEAFFEIEFKESLLFAKSVC